MNRSQRTDDARRWYGLTLLCAVAFMVILDASIVMVAIPSIETDLKLSPEGAQWVFSAYALTFGGLLMLGGRTADLAGRRRMFLVGVGLFGVSSLTCGLAWTGGVLIAARATQGVAAAIMMPTALSILTTTFPEGAERNRALGIWASMGGIGGTAGSLIGGPLTDGPGWSWIFFINVPVCLAALAVGPILLRVGRPSGRRSGFDLAGAATITVALALLVFAVVEAPNAGWASARTIAPLVASAALTALFVLIERRCAAPMVPPRIFRSRALVGGNLVMLTIGMAVFGMNIILTRYGQQVLGYSAVRFGLMSSVVAATAIVGSIAGQHLVTRVGVRPVVAASLVLVGVGCLSLTGVSAHGNYVDDILFGLLVIGPGLGAGTVAASIAALGGVAERDSGLASGLNTMGFQLGGALGIAVLTSVAVSRTAAVHAGTGGEARLFALTEGFRYAFGTASLFAALGLVAALVLLRRRRQRAPRDRVRPDAAGPERKNPSYTG